MSLQQLRDQLHAIGAHTQLLVDTCQSRIVVHLEGVFRQNNLSLAPVMGMGGSQADAERALMHSLANASLVLHALNPSRRLVWAVPANLTAMDAA